MGAVCSLTLLTISSGIPANSHTGSGAAGARGAALARWTARLHRTQRLPRPDWQVCSSGPTAPRPTGGRVNRWHPRRRPVGPDGRRRVSGEDNAVRVSPTQGVIYSRCSHGNQLHVSYHEFFLTTPVWTSFCGSTTSTRHNVGESLPYTRASRELNGQSALKHTQCLLCVTSCYFVAFFSRRGD